MGSTSTSKSWGTPRNNCQVSADCAGVSAGSQVDGERHVAIRSQIPADSVELIAFDAGNLDALPGKPSRLPGLTLRAPRQQRVMPREEEEPMLGKRPHFEHRAILHLFELLGL